MFNLTNSNVEIDEILTYLEIFIIEKFPNLPKIYRWNSIRLSLLCLAMK